MKKITNFPQKRFFAATIIAFLLPAFVLYGQDNKQTGPITYNYPANKPISYSSTTKVAQTMDIQGQTMQTNVNSYVGVTLKSTGLSGVNSTIEVKLDSIYQTVDSPAGNTGGNVEEVKGKTFNITVAPDGKITDSHEAEAVKYEAGNGTQSDAVQIIDNFFPVLPSIALTTGYTWTTNDSINSKTPGVTTTGTVTAESTFAGYETYKGMNCAKITTLLSGTRIMKTQQNGMDIKVSGPYTGTMTVYFAPAEGIFVKQEMATKMEGTIDITTPDQMTFPIVMEITLLKETR